jgi:tyrosinase
MCIRKEVRQLSAQERAAFLAAVKQLQSGPAPTAYDRLVKLHMDATAFAHGTAYFLTWHRAYLRTFELALQAIDPSVCLPYWSWALDSQAPETSVLFSNDWYGMQGTGADGCMNVGQLAGWRPAYPQPHCWTRRFNGGNRLGALHSTEAVNRVISGNTDYDSARRQIEGVLHPGVHNEVGGDMSSMNSPNDPMFWHHHSYIDFMWLMWQRMHGRSQDFGGAGPNGAAVSPDDRLLGLDYRVADTFDTSGLCYEYAELQTGDLGDDRAPPATVARPTNGERPAAVSIAAIPDATSRFDPFDRTNLASLRVPRPTDEAWLAMNGQDVGSVRAWESEYRDVYGQLNGIRGYVSPCALWSRPTLVADLVRQQPQTALCVDVPSVGRIQVDPAQASATSDPLQMVSNIKQVCEYTSSDIQLPATEYVVQLQKIVGKQAFQGAGAVTTRSDATPAKAAAAPTAGPWRDTLHATGAVWTFMALAIAAMSQFLA